MLLSSPLKFIPFAAWEILKIIFQKGRELRLFGKVSFCSIALCALSMCLNSVGGFIVESIYSVFPKWFFCQVVIFDNL